MSLESVTKTVSDNDGSRIDARRLFQTRRPWTVNDGHVSECGLVGGICRVPVINHAAALWSDGYTSYKSQEYNNAGQ